MGGDGIVWVHEWASNSTLGPLWDTQSSGCLFIDFHKNSPATLWHRGQHYGILELWLSRKEGLGRQGEECT